jgi:hypothetical protein
MILAESLPHAIDCLNLEFLGLHPLPLSKVYRSKIIHGSQGSWMVLAK